MWTCTDRYQLSVEFRQSYNHMLPSGFIHDRGQHWCYFNFPVRKLMKVLAHTKHGHQDWIFTKYLSLHCLSLQLRSCKYLTFFKTLFKTDWNLFFLDRLIDSWMDHCRPTWDRRTPSCTRVKQYHLCSQSTFWNDLMAIQVPQSFIKPLFFMMQHYSNKFLPAPQ